MGVLGLVVAFYVLKGFFTVLWWAAPVLFVLALVINWRSVANTGRWLLRTLQASPLRGLVLLVLGIVAFPVLSLFLFLQALGVRRVEQFRQEFGQGPGRRVEEKGEFVDYEELESRPKTPLKAWPEFDKEKEEP